MPIILVFFILMMILASVLIVPISILRRYRVGVSRQPARGWLIALNLAGFVISSMIFIVGAAMTNFWVSNALLATVAGWLIGGLLGLVGLALTRWERAPGTLYFTPNRWLVLTVTLVVAARLLYGLWRSWHAWDAGIRAGFAAAGVEGSLGAGALVLGYYVVYWSGVRRQSRIANPKS